MANIWEKAKSILAENLNSGLSYIIITVLNSMFISGLVDTLVTHANKEGFGLTPLSEDHCGNMPPLLKTKKHILQIFFFLNFQKDMGKLTIPEIVSWVCLTTTLLSLRKQKPLFDFHGSLVIEERTVNPNQGPHKKWMEHFNQSHFLKLQLTGAQDH